MGRNAKPVSVLKIEGKSHKTKSELEARENAEIKLGNKTIKMPTYVKADKIASQKWRELIKEYKLAAENGIELLTSSDADSLARYCITHSEYISLLEMKSKADEIEDLINKQKFIANLNNDINKKNELLNRLSDRLFLNPLAKIKNVPQQQKATTDKFGELFD